MSTTNEQIVEGAVAKMKMELAGDGAYATSGTPNLEALSLVEVSVSEAEMEQIIAQVEEAIKVDEGRKELFDAAIGFVKGLLLNGRAFVLK